MDGKAIRELVQSLDMRINFMQTGQVHLSATDIERCGEGEIKALSVEQMRMIVYLEDLKKRLDASEESTESDTEDKTDDDKE